MNRRTCWWFITLLLLSVLSIGVAVAQTPIRDSGSRDLDGLFDSGGPLGPVAGPPAFPPPPPPWTLGDFDFETLDPQGWTTKDRTDQSGIYFHVDDYAGLAGYAGGTVPIQGSHSLWCGARVATGPPLCTYATLPGYGNNWDQSWCTKTCIDVSGDGVLDVSFNAYFDSEPGYDATELDYTVDCSGTAGWTRIDGGPNVWDGILDLTGTPYASTYDISGVIGTGAGNADVKVRLLFHSDGAFSDEDAGWPTDGACHFDNLQVEGLALEDFESESVGAQSSDDWSALGCGPTGYGDFACLLNGASLWQENGTLDLTSVWAFICGSTDVYCRNALQTAVPFVNAQGLYIWNEICSPWMDWNPGGAVDPGATTELTFDVYRDLPLDNLVFYTWHYRTREDPTDCPTAWKDKGFVYYGAQRAWWTQNETLSGIPVGNSTTRQIQVSLGVIDMKGIWGGLYGSGTCHSHAPLFDNVLVERTNTHLWVVNDMDLFQDNFAEDGTTTGTVRVDAATGADAAKVVVTEPSVGIDDLVHGNPASGPAVICHVKNLPGKSGATVSGGANWPEVPSLSTANWTAIQMHATGDENEYDVDLNDALYVPGDTVFFYFSARDKNLNWSHWSQPIGLTTTESEAQSYPTEMTCLPANAVTKGHTILYVDGCSGLGAEPFFMTAFAQLDITPDRFDVRSPTSLLGNGPGGRVKNVATQLGVYTTIIWNTGDLSPTGLTAADYSALLEFVDNLTTEGGLYLSGNDFATDWAASTAPDAATLRSTYLNFSVLNDDQRAIGESVYPLVIGQPGLCFDHVSGPDMFMLDGGRVAPADFDVLTGASIEMAYGGDPGHGAVVADQTVNSHGATVGVMLSGFSYDRIRNDDPKPDPLFFVIDRTHHLYDALLWLGNLPPQPVASGPRAPVTFLAQNYPNPFNPQTAIDYTLAESGTVRLEIFDVAGRLVRTLVDPGQTVAPGPHRAYWDGIDDRGARVASGVYFYRLKTGTYTKTRKMVLLR